MKKFTLILTAALLLTSSAFAQVDVTTDPALPITFDESWGSSFLVEKTGVKTGDKFIFTAEPVTAVSWKYGSQILPKSNNAGWSNLGTSISVPTSGDYVFTVTAAYSDSINSFGGLRVQGVDAKLTAVKYQTATVIDPNTEQTHVFDVTKTDQLWSNATNDGTGTITFSGAWAGAGWWIQSLDISAYKSVVFELSEASTINLLPQIFAKDADGKDANVSKTINAGETIAALALSSSAATYSTIMMQNFAAGTCKLKKVYLSSLSADDALSVATGIGKINMGKSISADAYIYNIAGQNVGTGYKGNVNQNGKKFIQK